MWVRVLILPISVICNFEKRSGPICTVDQIEKKHNRNTSLQCLKKIFRSNLFPTAPLPLHQLEYAVALGCDFGVMRDDDDAGPFVVKFF